MKCVVYHMRLLREYQPHKMTITNTISFNFERKITRRIKSAFTATSFNAV